MTVEHVSTLKIEDAFKELENRLLNEKCKIVSKNFPNNIGVEHGSLVNWSYSPKMILKKVSFYLSQYQEGTKVVGVTDFPTTKEGITATAVWFTLLILGIISLSLAGMLRSWDLTSLATVCNVLAIISFLIIPFSILFELFCYVKRDEFVEELLKTLP